MGNKVLVGGLDGAGPMLVYKWARDLPTFSKFIEDGHSRTLHSTIPSLSSSAWVSYTTGKNIGKHGTFDFI